MNDNLPKIIYCTDLAGEVLSNFLVDNIDLNISMGTAALESSVLGIPTILVDASHNIYPNSYKYRWLYECKYYDLGKKYMPKGAGSVFTFGLKGGYDAGRKSVERCELFSHLANIGDTRSLILHPASTTHRQLTDEQRIAAGAGDDVIRVSIGLETEYDIIADLNYALV